MRAVLTYEDTGSKRIGGQTIGADGSGEFCIIYTGDEEKIHLAAKKVLADLESSHRLGKWLLVYDEEGYYGKSIVDILV